MLNTLSNQETNSHQTTLPTLWTEDFISAHVLADYFRIALPGSEGEGNHILAMQSEVTTRLLARKIQAARGKVDVYPCLNSLEVSIAGMGVSAVPMILMGAIPYEQWLESIRNEPLKLEDAVAIATDILSTEPDSAQRNITLDTLRRRADVSEYNWDKKYLDPIRERLERALSLSSEVGATYQNLPKNEQRQLDLKALAEQKDLGDFYDARTAFCRRYGWSRQEVDQAIRLIKTTTTTPKAKRLKGKDFLALETEVIGWIFAGIVPNRGVSIWGGDAGVGKTTLAYDAVGSLLLQEEFLGEKPVKKGKVLIVTGDELPCFTQDKLIDRGIPLDNEDWDIILNWDVSQWDVLEEALAEVKPDLVVIDSFSSIHRDPNFDENSSQAKTTIYDLEALTNTHNCGCILIHHLSKSKDNKGVGKLRGSSALAAAASVVGILEQMPNGTRRLSFPKMRGAQTEPFLYELDKATGRAKVISGGDDTATKSLGDRILDYLSKEPFKPLEQEEISAALGIPASQKDSVYQALGRLFKRGLITKRPSKQGGKRKVYSVANPYQLSQVPQSSEALTNVTDIREESPPLPLLNVSVQSLESIDVKGIEVTDRLTDTLTDTQLTVENELPLVSTSNVDVEGVTAKLTDTDTQGYESPLVVDEVVVHKVTAETTTPTEATQDEPQQVPAPTYEKVRLGSWARVEGKLAQVVAHYSHGNFFKSEDHLIYGVYREYELLAKNEMLKLGLDRFTLVR